MNDKQESNDASLADQILELNFLPTWAREPAASNPYAQYAEPTEAKKPPRDRRRTPRPLAPPKPVEPRRAPPEPPPRDLRVSFIPEQRRLGILVQELRRSGRAYPLSEIAQIFLKSRASHLIKLEVTSSSDSGAAIWSCKACGQVFSSKEKLTQHALDQHLDMAFEVIKEEVPPPSGQFTCVARCGLTGTLLGPPNYHEYNERVQDLWRKKFSHMSLDEYRAHVELVRDPEVLEEWKRSMSTRTVYRPKNAPERPPLTEAEARQLFADQHLSGILSSTRRLILTEEQTAQLTDESLRRAIREAWAREHRRPTSLMLALRAALSRMGLHLFRTPNGQTFVTAIRPNPLDPHRAVKNISEVLFYLQKHPGCTRRELVEKLRPGMPPDSPQAGSILHPLSWLIEKGHVVEFFNGTLAVPSAPLRK